MRTFETEFKLKAIKSFFEGDGRAILLARQWSVPEEKIRTWARSLMVIHIGSEIPRCTNTKWTVITLKQS
ncbi:transposase [Limnohabitans sp. 2KL-51]|uniref:transposase n=1 Tax=Limnohabitans sp. 2KL-51 TaxID=1977911 RepID=UPI00351769E4